MVCPACARPSNGLCRPCSTTLLPASDRIVGHIVTAAAYQHRGAAALLVRNLKYRRSAHSADVLARAMAPRLRDDVAGVAPIPRALSRRMVHGVDPAQELAVRIHRMTGAELLSPLHAPVLWPRHAGKGRSRRRPIRFRAAMPPPGHIVLIDDVVTTGATALSAVRALQASVRAPSDDGGNVTFSVLAATSAGTMSKGDQVSHEEVA